MVRELLYSLNEKISGMESVNPGSPSALAKSSNVIDSLRQFSPGGFRPRTSLPAAVSISRPLRVALWIPVSHPRGHQTPTSACLDSLSLSLSLSSAPRPAIFCLASQWVPGISECVGRVDSRGGLLVGARGQGWVQQPSISLEAGPRNDFYPFVPSHATPTHSRLPHGPRPLYVHLHPHTFSNMRHTYVTHSLSFIFFLLSFSLSMLTRLLSSLRVASLSLSLSL